MATAATLPAGSVALVVTVEIQPDRIDVIYTSSTYIVYSCTVQVDTCAADDLAWCLRLGLYGSDASRR